MAHSRTNKSPEIETDDDHDWLDDDFQTGESNPPKDKSLQPAKADETPWYWKPNTILEAYDPALWWKGSKRTMRKDKNGRSHPVGFESVKTCLRKWRFRINALRKGDASMQALAELLGSCHRDHRCGSLACPICMRRMRRVIVSNALYGIDGLVPQYHSTLALEEYVMSDHSDLGKVDKLRSLFLQTKRKLRRNGGVLTAWLEVAFDPMLGGFLPHLHIYSAGYKKRDLRVFHPGRDLDSGRRRIKDPLRRVRVKKGDEMETMTYVYKQFQRRNGSRKRRAVAEGRYSLSDEPSIEMKRLTFIGALRAEDMVLLKGLKRDRNGSGLRRTVSNRQ
jgi:hypothetical protein